VPGSGAQMTAVRKTDTLAGGHKLAFLAEQARNLTGDELKLLLLLTHHLGSLGCFPGQELLVKETGWSQTKVRRVRDALTAKGLINFNSGTGHQSTRYRLVALISWWEGKAPRVPNQASEGAAQSGTEELNRLPKKPAAPPDLKVVVFAPQTGWAGLLAKAPEDYRHLWLRHLKLDAEEEDGTVLLSTDQSFIAARIRADLRDEQVLGKLAREVGLDPEKIKIKAPKRGHDPNIAAQVRDGDDFDLRRSAGRQGQRTKDFSPICWNRERV
jgi:hypothetical protein